MAPHGDEIHGAAEATAAMTGMEGMEGMDSTSTMSMMMMSVFQTSMDTPLYSTTWTPNSVGTYAATCIFLIVLGVTMRGLLAAKSIQESRWLDKELNRRYVKVQGRLPIGGQISQDSLNQKMMLSENGVEEDVMVVAKKRTHARPWRVSVDPVRAVIDTIIAGVGYLL